MSVTGAVTLTWCGAKHTFRLGIDELVALQERTGHGPEATMRRLQRGEWHVDEIRETLRLGLIGAGMKESRALTLIVLNIDQRRLMASKQTAIEVLRATLLPFVEHPLPAGGSSPGKAGAATTMAAGASTSPPSTETPSSSG